MSEEYATTPEPGTVRVERVLPAGVDRVWAYLTDPALRATLARRRPAGAARRRRRGPAVRARSGLRRTGTRTLPGHGGRAPGDRRGHPLRAAATARLHVGIRAAALARPDRTVPVRAGHPARFEPPPVDGIPPTARRRLARAPGRAARPSRRRCGAAVLDAAYHEGLAGEFDWPIIDDEFTEFSVRQLDEADTLLFGRNTYQTMAGYWPTATARTGDPAVASRMNGLPKIVVSRSLARTEWAGTRIVKDEVAGHLTDLKE